MACRSAASSSTWTAARWRTQWLGATRSPERVPAAACASASAVRGGRVGVAEALGQPVQPAIALVAPRRECAILDRLAHGALRFAQVAAIGETAVRARRCDLAEAECRRQHPIDSRRKIAHA